MGANVTASPVVTLEMELEAAAQPCCCQPICSMLPLMAEKGIEPGKGVLSCCFKNEIFFADLTPAGTLLTQMAAEASVLCLDSPCNLVRLAALRVGESVPSSLAQK